MSRSLAKQLILFLAVSALGCSPGKPAETPTSFAGFQFVVPEKWLSVAPDRDKTAAMLAFGPGSKPQALIKVDVGKPTTPSIKDIARALAGPDGKVLPDDVMIDGEPGTKAESTSTNMSRPRLAIALMHNDRLYLIMAASDAPGPDLNDAVDHIIKTWKWTK